MDRGGTRLCLRPRLSACASFAASTVQLSCRGETTRDAFQAEFDQLSEARMLDADDLPDEVDERLSELEEALEVLRRATSRFLTRSRLRVPAPSSASHGAATLRVARGYVRSEDELSAEPETNPAPDEEAVRTMTVSRNRGSGMVVGDEPVSEPEEDEGLPPIPDRLITELTSHRTLGLRYILGEQPDVAFLAALHALTLKVFYHYGLDSCLELDLKSVSFSAQATGLNDSISAEAIRVRHEAWTKALPKEWPISGRRCKRGTATVGPVYSPTS